MDESLVDRELCLAIDIGGSKICVGLVDHTGVVVTQTKIVTPTAKNGDVLFSALADVIKHVQDQAPACSVFVCGVGCGGPMSPGGHEVSPLNITAWRGFPLRSRLIELTGLATFIDNDAKALAMGEGWLGAAEGHQNFMAMVVSTGIGGGIVLDGRLLDGRLGNAGHVGHVNVEPEGRRCPCGGFGCLEAEASGTAIAQITGKPPAEATEDVIARCGTHVGRAVASVANLLDLSLVVVAGSVALGFGAPFFAAAQSEIDRLARLDFSRATRIVPGGLGADGPLIGASAVGWRALFAAQHQDSK